MKLPKGWLNTKDVAKLSLEMTPDDVACACRKGALYHRRVGRSYQIPIKSAFSFAKKFDEARG